MKSGGKGLSRAEGREVMLLGEVVGQAWVCMRGTLL